MEKNTLYFKEALQYINRINVILGRLKGDYLMDSNFIKIVEKHNYSKVSGTRTDEDKEIKGNLPENLLPMDIVDATLALLSVKESLLTAVAVAKKNSEFNLDVSTVINRDRQSVASVLHYLSTLKNSEEEQTGMYYDFNADKEQTSIRYPITTVSKLNFNRDTLNAIKNRLYNEADKESYEIEQFMLNTKVNIDIPFSLRDSVEDVLHILLAEAQNEA